MHSGKYLDIEDTLVQARLPDHGSGQMLIIEKDGDHDGDDDGDGAISTGDTVYLKAHSGKHLDIEDTSVQARWTDHGNWQKLIVEKDGNGAISTGDTIYLKAHTGKNLDIEGTSVQARWTEHGNWQKLIIKKTEQGLPTATNWHILLTYHG